jgi:hypothetical protein
MFAGALFPLKVRSTRTATFGTADLKTVARTHDGQDYAVKQLSDGPLIPASEFFAYHLCPACQIAVPYWALLEMLSGELAFGSRFEGGHKEWKDFSGPSRQNLLQEAAESVSAILALDVFLGNYDRHFGNFLFRPNLSKQWSAMAIDYSRAVFVNGLPMGPLPPPTCHTSNTIVALKKLQAWNGPAAVFAATAIQAVTVPAVRQWFEDLPEDWLDANQRQAVLSWWGGTEFSQRITETLNAL